MATLKSDNDSVSLNKNCTYCNQSKHSAMHNVLFVHGGCSAFDTVCLTGYWLREFFIYLFIIYSVSGTNVTNYLDMFVFFIRSFRLPVASVGQCKRQSRSSSTER